MRFSGDFPYTPICGQNDSLIRSRRGWGAPMSTLPRARIRPLCSQRIHTAFGPVGEAAPWHGGPDSTLPGPPDVNRHTPRLWEAWGFVNAESPSLISRGTFTSNIVPTIVTDHREVMPTELARRSAQESFMT